MWFALAAAGAAVVIVIFMLVQYKQLAIRAGSSEAEKELADEVLAANTRRQKMAARARVTGLRLVRRLQRRANRTGA